ncbi:MAG TPA: TIGR02266 family protein [Myxococcales bacterium LLY-WYZ-16_1]|jgi:uncharacterized protein (TIGR02266 family)|nr:TIGR02266 family protein [Myxococcales bacterium LLY-WYZ-16_1]
MGEDNRRAPRLPAEIKVDYRSLGRFITDYTTNISRLGVFVRTSMPLPVGERVRIRLSLPDGEVPFALDGEVKWVASRQDREKHDPGMGIEFVDDDPEVQEKLEELLRAHGG